jgi:Bor protein
MTVTRVALSGRTKALCVGVLWACMGCAATTVHSGRAPSDLAEGYDERWHSAFLWGVVPASGPYDLAKICPNGWSQVTVGRDPSTLLVSVLTLFIYSPTRVSVVCAALGGPALPPAQGYAPNAPFMPDSEGSY